MIKAVLFDLDGTLIDTNKLILESFRHTFKSVLNREVSDEEITLLFGKPLDATFSLYDKERVKELISVYREYNKKNHDNMCNAFDGAKELIKEIKSMGIKVGIVTSKKEDMAKRGMEINGILEFMDVIMTPEKTEKHKPDKEPVIKACEELNINPSEAIMVGDSNFDIMSGKSAGSKTIAVKYTVLPIEEVIKANPDYLVDRPMDILDIINKLNTI